MYLRLSWQRRRLVAFLLFGCCTAHFWYTPAAVVYTAWQRLDDQHTSHAILYTPLASCSVSRDLHQGATHAQLAGQGADSLVHPVCRAGVDRLTQRRGILQVLFIVSM